MRVNENLAVVTPAVLLVPYDAHHVRRYHEWMQNDALREATASDLLTLDEEYENQQSWRTAHDKLTFIVCQPASDDTTSAIYAGEADAPARMVGDINLFLTPDDDDDDDGDVKGEIDIMVAVPEHRRQGLGEAAVRAFLRFLAGNVDAIMREYSLHVVAGTRGSEAKLKRLVAKIHATNAGSLRLFEKLGFKQDGEPDYFNEISLVLADFPPAARGLEGLGYKECVYDRSRLKK